MGRGRAANTYSAHGGTAQQTQPTTKGDRPEHGRTRPCPAVLLLERYASHSSVARAPRSCNEASADR